MTSDYMWRVIIIIALASYLPRAVPILVLSHYDLPNWFKTWLTFVPTAIFGALVFPDIFLVEKQLSFSLSNTALWATIIVAPLALKTKSLGYTIMAGGLIFTILQKIF